MAFPLNSKPDWRNPPWMTVLLILINCFIFIGPQQSDEKREEKALQAYVQGALPRLELPRYAEYLRQRAKGEDREKAAWIEKALQQGHTVSAYELMSRDVDFMALLDTDQIVRNQDEDYPQWKTAHQDYKRIRGSRFTETWASNPGHWNPLTLLTSMFLHGSWMHLIGNMVFLFAFGYTVEMSLGARRYLLFYLLSGAAGDIGDLAARWGEPVIGLGASGAISGLMAIYAVLYGLRKIKFFYQLFFYFDYVTAPAIILLPVWILDQLVLQLTDAGNGVAYMAHVGGLLAGGLLGGIYRWLNRSQPLVLPEAPPPDPFPPALAKAESLVQAMKLNEARQAFLGLLAMRPNDAQLHERYFNLARLVPAEEHFHRAAAGIFALPGDDLPTVNLIAAALPQYLKLAQPRPRLTPDQLARLALRMAAAGQKDSAEKMAGALLKLVPGHPQLPSALFAVATMHKRQGNQEQSERWRQWLLQYFPSSAEARLPW